MNVRRTLAALGATAGVAGLALVLVPGLAEGMSVARLFVFLLGALAALLAVADVRTLARNEVEQASPATVEAGVEHPRPGADVDDLLAAAARGYDRSTQGSRDRVEERVRAVAVDVLARRESCTREEAEATLAEGSWTDDPYAAAFLGAIEVENLPLRERIVDALRPEARVARRARAAIDAVAEREGLDVRRDGVVARRGGATGREAAAGREAAGEGGTAAGREEADETRRAATTGPEEVTDD